MWLLIWEICCLLGHFTAISYYSYHSQYSLHTKTNHRSIHLFFCLFCHYHFHNFICGGFEFCSIGIYKSIHTRLILCSNNCWVSLIAKKTWFCFVFICFTLIMFFFLPISSFPEGRKSSFWEILWCVSLCLSKDYSANKQTN